jgi:O-methyltransferase
MLRRFILRTLNKLGYQLIRLEPVGPSPQAQPIPDAACYRPFFNPWLWDDDFNNVFCVIAPRTIVSAERCYVLWTLALQALNCPGAFIECGVYQGGTARLFAEIIARHDRNRRLHLFDTFEGMPATGPSDLHQQGDFADTSLSQVRRFVDHPNIATFYPGLIPETFSGLKSERIAFAHIDVDIYQSVLDCCEFIYPRLSAGGVVVFDDYGFPTCPGARRAVDEFFSNIPERPLILSTAQAVVIRTC